ncbi:hypothetical protein [Metabacillus halosaccharovorans]|uniref:hypothetical protein n=1 Tax=Metabacillus halosaccharovorans TaxID=930124 RepID=UPI000C80FAB1|nr:hypothetical protein [Metabacillus halosaccharovorans]MBU7595871.1 hypothetical protein [Metabacillus halosaccharovorans]PMC36273.1 hypothetical protein CJ195_15815 [Bacillus sp. UMB0899]
MIKINKLLNKTLILSVVLIMLPSILVFGFSDDKHKAVVSGKVLNFDGYTLLLKTNDEKIITGKFRNILIADTKDAWAAFDEILSGALVEVELYGRDKEGDYLVELYVDGYDFDEYAVDNHFAFYLKE